jgi:hypothetical protein
VARKKAGERRKRSSANISPATEKRSSSWEIQEDGDGSGPRGGGAPKAEGQRGPAGWVRLATEIIVVVSAWADVSKVR